MPDTYQIRFNVYGINASNRVGHSNVEFWKNGVMEHRIGMNVPDALNGSRSAIDANSTLKDGVVREESGPEFQRYDNPAFQNVQNVTQAQYDAAYAYAEGRRAVPTDANGANANYLLWRDSCYHFAQNVWKLSGGTGHFLQSSNVPTGVIADNPLAIWFGAFHPDNSSLTPQQRERAEKIFNYLNDPPPAKSQLGQILEQSGLGVLNILSGDAPADVRAATAERSGPRNLNSVDRWVFA